MTSVGLKDTRINKADPLIPHKIPQKYFKIYFYICLLHVHTHRGNSEDSLQEYVLFFHHVGLEDGTQILRLGGKDL